MTDQDPSARDELIAAYLDGEVTPAQRAIVERDPALLARAQLLQQVAVAVGEPVLAPPAHVRREHIAAALEASDTAPNVSSMATRRRAVDFTTLAAAAAVVLLILAVPIVLLRDGSGDGDTVATNSVDASAADESSAIDGAISAAPQAEAALTDDEAEAGAPAVGALPADEPADEPAAAAAEEPAEEAAEEPAEDAGADTDEEDGSDQSGELFQQSRVFSPELVADELALADQVLAFISSDSFADLDDGGDAREFQCVLVWLGDNPDIDPASVLVIGDAVVNADGVNYVATQTPLGVRLVVLPTGSCNPSFDEIVG